MTNDATDAETNGATPPPRNHRSRNRVIGLVIAIALILVAAEMVWYQTRDTGSSVGHSSPSAATSSATVSSAAPSASSTPPSPTAIPDGCAARPTPIIPVSMKIDQMNITTQVLPLGLDSSGAAAAPPKDDPSAVAWFDQGPRPGSSQGKVVLSTHTYHSGNALGNALYDSQNGLKHGDIIRLADASGTTVCYRFDHRTKVLVKDYDPSSTVLYDNSGAPMVAIVICWDYDRDTNDWGSRVIFYATPVADSAA